MTTAFSEQTVKSEDGIELVVYKWATSGNKKPKAQLLIAHGYLEHGRRYGEFAEVLSQKHQIAVTVYDFRGHGNSSGARAFVRNWKDYHADLDAVLATVDDESPKFVLGHSNGGLVCLDYFSDKDNQATVKEIRGLIITSPWLGPAKKLPYIKVLASKLLGNIFPKLTLPVDKEELSGKVLTHDPVKVKENDDDEMNLRKLTVGWAYQALLAQQRVTTECKHIPVPLLFAYAELDLVADPELNKKFGQMVAADDKTILERKGEYHEILNETDRKELYEIFAEWILKRT